jgi:hypothetical protein
VDIAADTKMERAAIAERGVNPPQRSGLEFGGPPAVQIAAVPANLNDGSPDITGSVKLPAAVQAPPSRQPQVPPRPAVRQRAAAPAAEPVETQPPAPPFATLFPFPNNAPKGERYPPRDTTATSAPMPCCSRDDLASQ